MQNGQKREIMTFLKRQSTRLSCFEFFIGFPGHFLEKIGSGTRQQKANPPIEKKKVRWGGVPPPVAFRRVCI
jgi:hypothetical protein